MLHFAIKCSDNVMCDLLCYSTYYCIPVLFVGLLGRSGIPLRASPYWEISLTHFLWCFQMERIMVTIEMDVALVYDFVY